MDQPFSERFGNLTRDAQRAIRNAFARETYHDPYNRTWRPGGYLGGGGEGIAGLWVQIGPNETILNRMVIKQAMPGEDEFKNPDNWVSREIGGEPLEYNNAIKLWTQLTELAGRHRNHMVEPLGYGTPDKTKLTYRLYLEYCRFGTLRDIVKDQAKHTRNVLGLELPAIVPEPFIWHMLQSMAEALDAMDDTGMVHGDLQGGNILFSEPDKQHFPAYPTPKLGDFGSSVFVTAKDGEQEARAKCNEVRVAACQTYAPPELFLQDDEFKFEDDDQYPDHAYLSAKTNIWQLGMLALCLMRCRAPIQECNFLQRPVEQRIRLNFESNHNLGAQTVDVNDYKEELGHTYSVQLRKLVQDMLSFEPSDRPTPKDLLESIQDVTSHKKGLFDGMRTCKKVAAAHKNYLHVVSLKDKFRVGKKWQAGEIDA